MGFQFLSEIEDHMEEFPSNSSSRPAPPSERAEEPQKKVDRVVQGPVTRRKKPLSRRFSETFTGGDARGVGSYILLDVLVPAARDMIVDAVTTGVERLVLGDARPASRRGHRAGTFHTPYHSRSSGGRPEPRSSQRRTRSMHDFEEILTETRAEAEELLRGMDKIMDRFHVVSVADLYDLAGITGQYTDNKWGWTDLDEARVYRLRGEGYVLDLPKPKSLD